MVERRLYRPEVVQRKTKGDTIFKSQPPVESVPVSHTPSEEAVHEAIERGKKRLHVAAEIRMAQSKRMRAQENARRLRQNKPAIIG